MANYFILTIFGIDWLTNIIGANFFAYDFIMIACVETIPCLVVVLLMSKSDRRIGNKTPRSGNTSSKTGVSGATGATAMNTGATGNNDIETGPTGLPSEKEVKIQEAKKELEEKSKAHQSLNEDENSNITI